MIVQSCKNTPDRYEASGQINEINLELLDGTRFYMDFIGFGDTLFEAIESCMRRMDKHLHPGDYEKCMICKKVECMCYDDYKENNQF